MDRQTAILGSYLRQPSAFLGNYIKCRRRSAVSTETSRVAVATGQQRGSFGFWGKNHLYGKSITLRKNCQAGRLLESVFRVSSRCAERRGAGPPFSPLHPDAVDRRGTRWLGGALLCCGRRPRPWPLPVEAYAIRPYGRLSPTISLVSERPGMADRRDPRRE